MEKYCDKCKEVVDSVERNDGYATPDYGHYDVFVDVCPKCGNTDLEDVDLEKIEIDWEVGDEYDDAGDGHCFFHHAEGEDESGNTYTASASLVDGELVEIEDIEKVENN